MEIWIDDHFQRILKGLVRKFVDAENDLYALQERIKRLKLSKREKKVPSGMKIHCVKAKGKHTTPLQETFDGILREAEFKLLDATLAALRQDEQHCRDRCTEEKANISKAINTWREGFKASESSLSTDADQFVASAKYFCNDFYFKCVAIRTSKRVTGDIKKANKVVTGTEQMEADFQPNERTIKDMVAREVEKELSKLQTVPGSTKKKQPTRQNHGGKTNSRSSSRTRSSKSSNGNQKGKQQTGCPRSKNTKSPANSTVK